MDDSADDGADADDDNDFVDVHEEGEGKQGRYSCLEAFIIVVIKILYAVTCNCPVTYNKMVLYPDDDDVYVLCM